MTSSSTSVAPGENLVPMGFEICVEEDDFEVHRIELVPPGGITAAPLGLCIFIPPDRAYITEVRGSGVLPCVVGPVEAAAWSPRTWEKTRGYAVPFPSDCSSTHELPYVVLEKWPSFNAMNPLQIEARRQPLFKEQLVVKGMFMCRLESAAPLPIPGAPGFPGRFPGGRGGFGG